MRRREIYELGHVVLDSSLLLCLVKLITSYGHKPGDVILDLIFPFLLPIPIPNAHR